MQISKSFLVVCGAAYCLSLLPLGAADADVDTKLREALRQKMNELDAQPALAVPQPAVPAPSPQKAPAPVAKPAPSARPTPPAQWTPATAAQPAPVAKPAPPGTKPSEPAPAMAAQPAPAPQPPVKPKASKAQSSLPPIQAPPPVVSADKEQRLQDLLTKYRADQISPEEYHLQRAKILAEP